MSDFDRNSGVGASEAAAVCSESKYEDPLSVYLRKVGLADAAEENAPMRWGKLLEPVILSEFERRRGTPVSSQQQVIRHPSYPWMYATIDGRLNADELVEAKTAGYWSADDFGDPGTDSLPAGYIVQCSHQMACTGAKVVHVPVLIGGQDYREYEVRRNADLLEAIIEREEAFWQRVQRREPPEPDFNRAGTSRLLELLHGEPNGIVQLTREVEDLTDAYEHVGKEIRENEKVKATYKAQLLDALGPAAVGLLPDGRTVERKRIARKSYTVEACEYIELRVRKARVAQ